MKDKFEIKEKLFNACVAHIEKRLRTISETLKSIEVSRNNETKSSAGDKFETGRAMMQLEDDKSKRQLFETNQVKNVLNKIDLKKRSKKVELGSLVTTKNAVYFVSIGIGKVTIEDGLYFCISINSPIGARMLGKIAGEEIEFNGRIFEIEGVC